MNLALNYHIPVIPKDTTKTTRKKLQLLNNHKVRVMMIKTMKNQGTVRVMMIKTIKSPKYRTT
jgi:hypothetical protein